jgi:hypothetical protein
VAGLGFDPTGIPPARLEYARLRGTALHLAIRYHHEGVLDETSLHPDLLPGFEAYLRFLADTKHEPIASELELIHPTYGFMGHADRIGWLNGKRVLLDWKYTEAFQFWPVAYQLAGYRLLWNAVHPTELVTQAFALQLHPKSEKYQLRVVEAEKYEQTFLAALVVWRARQLMGRATE